MSLTGRFRKILDSLPVTSPVARYVVAYSGGVDSHVLLHLCHRVDVPVRAIHINHGLQHEADQWTRHCTDVCKVLEIACTTINVDAAANQGESPENAARKARYAALYSSLQADECLLTAHHCDDQSETLLLQLFRGAGPAGLSSMPLIRTIQGVKHARPMLEFSRQEVLDYAGQNDLNWVEDPSNEDTEYDRNLVRRTILPLIRQRWPQLDGSLSQVAMQQQDALALIEDMAAIDLASVVTQSSNVLSVSAISRLSRARQFNVVRYWIHQHAKDRPTANALQQIIETVLCAVEDAAPVVSWGQTEVRRYQDGLYLMSAVKHDTKKTYSWNPRHALLLKELDVELSMSPSDNKGLSMTMLDNDFRVTFRNGGESIRPAGRGHTHQLKKLMQEAGIAPWMRSRIPLLYLDDELVCVCGYWLAEGYVAAPGEEGWMPVCHTCTD